MDHGHRPPLPETGQIFLDARGGDRALRVSWHAEAGLVVLSLWRDNVCSGLVPAGRRRRARPHRHAARGSRPGVRRDADPPPRCAESTDPARRRRYGPSMDPVRNPYAPGAGQRPPELAGRDRELQQFEVTLERVAAGRPERCMVLCGLRGVGKTVLLNALRGAGRPAGVGDRQDRGAARPEHPDPGRPGGDRRDPRGQPPAPRPRPGRRGGRCGEGASRCGRRVADRKGLRWTPPVDVPAAKGRADSGDLELDLTELFTDVAARGRRPRRGGGAVRRRDAGHRARRARRDLRRLPRDQPAGRAAAARRRRAAAPAGGAVGVEVVRRAAVPLRRRRPARPAPTAAGR